MKALIKPQACKNIKEIRDSIDLIDQEIIQLFAERHAYVKEIVKFKGDEKEEIIAKERKDLVLKQRKAWAAEKGLNAEMMEEVFKLLIKNNIQIQLDITKSNNK